MPLLFNMLSSFIIFSINIVYRFNNSDLLFTGPWILPITHSCETIGLSVRSVLLIQSLSTYYWLSNTGWAIHLFQLKKQNSSAIVVFLKHLRYQYIQPTVSPPEISLSRDISTLIYLFISFSCYEPSVKCFIRLLICNSLPLLSALLGYKQSAHSSSMYFPASQESSEGKCWCLYMPRNSSHFTLHL